MVGDAFGVIKQTGAMNNGILALISKIQKTQYLIIPLMFLLFSLGGAIFGMDEEVIAYCLVLLPLIVAMMLGAFFNGILWVIWGHETRPLHTRNCQPVFLHGDGDDVVNLRYSILSCFMPAALLAKRVHT